MAKLESLSHVGVFVRDQKKAREFYVKKLELKVRGSIPRMGYLLLGATKGGEDAGVNLWQPTREAWGDKYDQAVAQIGVVTGIGFRTTNLDKTLASLKRRGVKVNGPWPEGDGRVAGLSDPDGNVLFAYEPPRPKARRAGLQALDFITIATRDHRRAGEFFTKALGMKGKGSPGEPLAEYRLSPRGTALSPFTPTRENYDDPKDYEEDMAHIGEDTSIMFRTKDIYGLQEKLMANGVRFMRKAEKAAWGGIEAEFLDSEDNRYLIIQTMP